MNWKNKATLGVSVKLRNDYADYDYLDQLSPKDLKWLNGFHREYINADFKHKHTKHFKTKKEKKLVYDLNNTRNRDLYNIYKWTGDLYLNSHLDNITCPHLQYNVEKLLELILELDNDTVKKIIKKIDKKKKVV